MQVDKDPIQVVPWPADGLRSMVRRRSTVRFRNGAQVDDLIRKDSNGSWMPVGTNGCPQGILTTRPAQLLSGPIRKGPEMPGQPVRSRIPSQPGGSERRAAAPVPAPSDRGTAWMPQVATPPGRARTPRRDGQARSAPAWRRDHVTGRVPRIASALIPASPAGPGRRPR